MAASTCVRQFYHSYGEGLRSEAQMTPVQRLLAHEMQRIEHHIISGIMYNACYLCKCFRVLSNEGGSLAQASL